MSPLVSIIIPTYNSASTLARTLDSIFAQANTFVCHPELVARLPARQEGSSEASTRSVIPDLIGNPENKNKISIKIIVVDNFSTDETPAIAKKYRSGSPACTNDARVQTP